MQDILAGIMHFGQLFLHFSPRLNFILWYWWDLNSKGRGQQSELREMWSHCLSLSQTQCIHCDWQGKLLIICLSQLPSEEKMWRCTHFWGTVITRATHLNWKKDCAHTISLSILVAPTALVQRQTETRSPLCFLLRNVEVWIREMEQSFKRHM